MGTALGSNAAFAVTPLSCLPLDPGCHLDRRRVGVRRVCVGRGKVERVDGLTEVSVDL